MNLRMKRLTKRATIPTYAHSTDAGFDIYAAENVEIEPGDTQLVGTGIALDIPEGYEVQIRPRSGITLRTGLRVQLGTIDAGYRGEIGVIVENVWPQSPVPSSVDMVLRTDGSAFPAEDYQLDGTYEVLVGDKIAQGVLKPIEHADFVEVEDFTEETARGSNGYGSTGVSE